ncbi:MAG: bifunctional 2-polyprenyl-6-hydroxyphenol methylase/3-demethylubiquinol 3-O-methyltransferase UbiG [Steroidobacteraceae bacterium]
MKATSPDARDDAEVAKFDTLAPRFWDEQGEFKPLHRLNPVRAAYVAERCGRTDGLAGLRVLDVGCGGGLLCEALAARGATVTGIDLSPGMIEVARLHAAERGVRISYQVAEAASLLDADEPFDVVCCMEMLEHVPDAGLVLGQLGRLVRPGGHLVVSTLNRNLRAFLGAIVGAEYVLRLLPRGTHEYERFIKPAELAGWARHAGLELRDLRGIDYDPFSAAARLTADVSVNYLAHLTRPSTPA